MRHRGAHPGDSERFGASAHATLAVAIRELSWLLNRGFASPSSLKLVGDRHQLDARQRAATLRCAAGARDVRRRRLHEVAPHALRGAPLAIDGYNLLTTIESALSGAVILVGRDSCFRDVASLHGSWRRVAESEPALDLIARRLAVHGPASCRWLLDRPVSNSGRLAQLIRDVAARHGANWAVDLVPDPDPLLKEATEVVVTADSVILDACARWTNLARDVIESGVPDPWLVPAP